ncbi:hypothetical protein [Lactobacillus sp. 3B(2020)]|uniref:hypothetical protein n=1 Tax=Lactobacillus sp. 3B(2020) TaxID=2695882 RepID=UPI0015E023E5|nr:hypothetical protein [Lactobacillus sp. 3B(2020)]QLL69796.1 hypothetical protein GTO83_04215 [Lactobacillus sp. 3B(2020)]
MATMDELAQTIATAATGKDVREAMAEAVRQFDDVKGEVYQRLKDAEDKVFKLQTKNDNLEKQVATLDKIQKNLDKRISDNQEAIADWSERVKHIVLGTDPETIELVVTKILEGKGLI